MTEHEALEELALARGRWDAMTDVEQFDYVVGVEAEVARLREALQAIHHWHHDPMDAAEMKRLAGRALR